MPESNIPPELLEALAPVNSGRSGLWGTQEGTPRNGCSCYECRRVRMGVETDIPVVSDFPGDSDASNESYVAPESENDYNPYMYGSANYLRFRREMRAMRDARLERAQEEQRRRYVGLNCTRCGVNRADRYLVDLNNPYQDITDRTDMTGVTPICEECRSSWYSRCNGCNRLVGNNDVCPNCPSGPESMVMGDENDLSDSSGECGYCYDCTRGDSCTNRTLVNNYSYRPTPVFYGKGPVYMGFELEMSGGSDEAASYAVSELGKLGYLKEDSSINNYGIELVTHPMSYEFAMARFPWGILSELSEYGMYADDSCGLHVHVSKTAFADQKHIYRWMKFFYRNEKKIIAIARRESDEWAKFDPNARKDIKNYAKGKRGSDRYCAINTTNRTTFEIRVFASSMNKTDIQAALALIDASVEYTRNLTTSDILRNKGWEWESFQNWLTDKYAPLRSEADKTCAC